MKTTSEIEKEIKDFVINFFTNFDETNDDRFGYVTDKITTINKLRSGEGWIAFNLLHALVRMKLYPKLSEDAQGYLLDNNVYIPNIELY